MSQLMFAEIQTRERSQLRRDVRVGPPASQPFLAPCPSALLGHGPCAVVAARQDVSHNLPQRARYIIRRGTFGTRGGSRRAAIANAAQYVMLMISGLYRAVRETFIFLRLARPRFSLRGSLSLSLLIVYFKLLCSSDTLYCTTFMNFFLLHKFSHIG